MGAGSAGLGYMAALIFNGKLYYHLCSYGDPHYRQTSFLYKIELHGKELSSSLLSLVNSLVARLGGFLSIGSAGDGKNLGRQHVQSNGY